MTIRNGLYERSYRWVDDRDNRIRVNAQRMDTEFDGIADAINGVINQTIGFKGPLKGIDGVLNAPGYAFADAPATGFYRKASGDIGVTVNGVEVFTVGPDEITHVGAAIQSAASLFGGPYTDIPLTRDAGADEVTNVTTLVGATVVMQFDNNAIVDRAGITPVYSTAAQALTFAQVAPNVSANVELGGVLRLVHNGVAGTLTVTMRGDNPDSIVNLGVFTLPTVAARTTVEVVLEASNTVVYPGGSYVVEARFEPEGAPGGNTEFGAVYSGGSSRHRLWMRRVTPLDSRALDLLEGILAEPLTASGPSGTAGITADNQTDVLNLDASVFWTIPVSWHALVDEGKAYLEISGNFDDTTDGTDNTLPDYIFPYGSLSAVVQFVNVRGDNVDPITVYRTAVFTPPTPQAAPGDTTETWSPTKTYLATIVMPAGTRSVRIPGIDGQQAVIAHNTVNNEAILGRVTVGLRGVRIFFGSPRTSGPNVLEANVLRALIEELCVKTNGDIAARDKLILSGEDGAADTLYAANPHQLVAAGVRHSNLVVPSGAADATAEQRAAASGHFAVRGTDGIPYRAPVSAVLGGGGGGSGTTFAVDSSEVDGYGLELSGGILKIVRRAAPAYARYAVWNTSVNPPTAAEFQAGTMSNTDTLEVPAGSGRLWFADRILNPTHIYHDGDDWRNDFTAVPVALDAQIGGETYYAYGITFDLDAFSTVTEWRIVA